MARYRKRPIVIVIDAFKFELGVSYPDWFKDATEAGTVTVVASFGLEVWCDIKTLEGTTMRGDYGDYIIKGIEGEIYPCKPDIFERTYDITDEGAVYFELRLDNDISARYVLKGYADFVRDSNPELAAKVLAILGEAWQRDIAEANAIAKMNHALDREYGDGRHTAEEIRSADEECPGADDEIPLRPVHG